MKRALILGLGALLVTAAMASAQTAPPPRQQAQVKASVGPNFVDANGDGICDNVQSGVRGANGQGKAYGRGKGDGTHVGPKDGTGFGARAGAGTGTGICDGTGPKGQGKGRRR
jgi:hypothetical protein